MRLLPGVPDWLGGRPPESALYPTRTRTQMVEQFLGWPTRDISMQQAHYYASQGK